MVPPQGQVIIIQSEEENRPSSVPVQALEAMGPVAQHSAQQLSSFTAITPSAFTAVLEAPQPVPLMTCLVTNHSLSESKAESLQGKQDQRQMPGPILPPVKSQFGAREQHQQVARDAWTDPGHRSQCSMSSRQYAVSSDGHQGLVFHVDNGSAAQGSALKALTAIAQVSISAFPP